MEQQYTSPITTQDDAAAKPPVDDGKLERYKAEYNRWLKKLEPYHTGRFDRNYKQYTAYTETKGTHTKISDPVAPELVERVVQKFFAQLGELSGGSLKVEIHDILASDLHACVLVTDKLTRNGKACEYRGVHVWRFQDGKPIAWYDYPRDLYQYDEIWG